MRFTYPPMILLLCVFLNFQFGNAQTNLIAKLNAPNSFKNSIVKDSIKYHTLYNALKDTELDALLTSTTDFTIFAPTEVAFNNISTQAYERLFCAEDKKLLNYTLASHIVPGKLTASKILKAMCNNGGKAVFTTIQGNKLIASLKGLDIIITDNLGNTTKIITADVNSSHTVIHEIDSVLIAANY